jgi:MoxR-like ATPase
METLNNNQEIETSGAYEIIRNRLSQHGKSLNQKLQTLNKKRIDVFGSTQMAVIGRTRIRTENNCVPRDIKEFGEHMLFGYNVVVGMRAEISVADVFSLHEIIDTKDGIEFHPLPNDKTFLIDTKFNNDFNELYRYYKDTYLSQLRTVTGKKLAIFQIGKNSKDIKIFRWRADNNIEYIDNRGEKDNIYPASHDFTWISTTREDHIIGKHPHISILDEVFVETIGGTLTIKIEDNTEDGLGIYSEAVNDPNQSLADAQVQYTKIGDLVLLKIRPYKEEQWRYLVFNKIIEKITRIDAIGQACIQLPEDHGLIFPGGFYLKNGETKFFEGDDLIHMTYKRMIRSPNGEDVLYVFHHEEQGKQVLFSYNLIRKEVQNPIICHGFSIFNDGRMVVFRADDDIPTRVHPMQIWQTPYYSDEYAANKPTDGSFMAKLGNAELVRGISEAYSIKHLLDEQSPTMGIYENLISTTTRFIDNFHWLEHQNIGNLLITLKEILSTAELIIDEFEKVQTLRTQATQSINNVENKQHELLLDLNNRSHWQSVEDFVTRLTILRNQRGQLISLKEQRYIDLPRLDEMEAEIVTSFNELSQATVNFLLDKNALAPYHKSLDEQILAIDKFTKSNEIKLLQENLNKNSTGLDLLMEVLSDLQINDAESRIRILEEISDVYAKLNRAKAGLELKRKSLLSSEAQAEFSAQFKLFSQSVAGAMSQADTPEKADEQLSRLMVQLEDLEGRFNEFDEFLGQIIEKREEVYSSLETRKQTLIEERQRRALNLSQAAERILQGIERRVGTLKTIDEQNSYFASDAMVLKVRELIKKLHKLGDSVKAGDIESKLKLARDQASRELRDKQDIFSDGGAVIKLGKHSFSVNTQELDLTLVPYNKGMALHLSGTEFFDIIENTELNQAKEYWEQSLVSENKDVYRGEFLAYALVPMLQRRNEINLLESIKKYAADRYNEGYERGVHDHDAALILESLLEIQKNAGLLKFSPKCRAYAQLFWAFYVDEKKKQIWLTSCKSLNQLENIFGKNLGEFGQNISIELNQAIKDFLTKQTIKFSEFEIVQAGNYLLAELKADFLQFTISNNAVQLSKEFLKYLEENDKKRDFELALRDLKNDLDKQLNLIQAWLQGFIKNINNSYVLEAATIMLTNKKINQQINSANTNIEIKGLLGQHPRIKARCLKLELDEFLERLQNYITEKVPNFHAFRKLKQQITEHERKKLRVDEFKPHPLSSFVRNRLINEVYLHLVGDNFAKQMGTIGENKRTDLMGMLLLISPPGYGKTTLMEYLAQRLGLVFMKINCPTIGHQVISLDPAEAPNLTARQELEKLNLALEMGNNVMLYLDDIQHSNPEFLQKFISMADAQRRIEGVWRGVTRTYDLRGKRFCVAMAGNPYTESGDAFKIPDMLTNRADIYNLGDVLNGKEEVFSLSYLENALTSNSVLAPLSTREPADVYKFMRLAKGEEVANSDFSYSYSATEAKEIVDIFKKLFYIQDIVLKVNSQYIKSAATADEYRTEPAFKLQGSYRNMNKLAEKIVAVMNNKELENLISDHYQGEAQTLTNGAEENLLKLAELRNVMTLEQQERWQDLKKTFSRLQSTGGSETDPVTRMVKQLSLLASQLDNIHTAIKSQKSEVGSQKSEDLTKLLKALIKTKANINITNKIPNDFQQVTAQMLEIIDKNLLPLSQDYKRKSRLDMVIWERLKEVSRTLKEMDKTAFERAKQKITYQSKIYDLDNDL